MKRIAISVVALLGGGILSAQINPQAALAVKSQVTTATQPAQAKASAPIQAQPMRLPAENVKKPTAQSKPSSSVAAPKVTAKSAAHASTPAKAPKPLAAQSAATKPASQTPKTLAVKKAPAPAPKKAVAKAEPKPVAKPAVKKTNEAETAKVKEAMIKTEKPVEQKPLEINVTGRRDPFTSPIMRALNASQGPACSSGKHCLAVDQIILRGIVRSPNGMIAVVENSAKRAYFLRENDPVWHGLVEKINGDSVVFREETVDSKTGKSTTHEVVKRVNAPVV